VLLEGAKLWTFLPPCSEELLSGHRLAPNAWGEAYNVSAGWQSSIDLYRDATTGSSSSGSGSSDSGSMLLSGRGSIPEHIWAGRLQVSNLLTVLSPTNTLHMV
jgi:hypothetical protein